VLPVEHRREEQPGGTHEKTSRFQVQAHSERASTGRIASASRDGPRVLVAGSGCRVLHPRRPTRWS
jgi:hypothetical protein